MAVLISSACGEDPGRLRRVQVVCVIVPGRGTITRGELAARVAASVTGPARDGGWREAAVDA